LKLINFLIEHLYVYFHLWNLFVLERTLTFAIVCVFFAIFLEHFAPIFYAMFAFFFLLLPNLVLLSDNWHKYNEEKTREGTTSCNIFGKFCYSWNTKYFSYYHQNKPTKR
jgi:dolichol kinase